MSQQSFITGNYTEHDCEIILSHVKTGVNLKDSFAEAGKILNRNPRAIYQFYHKRLKKKATRHNKHIKSNEVMIIQNNEHIDKNRNAIIKQNHYPTSSNQSMQLEVMLKLAASLSRAEKISLIQFLCN